LPNSGFSYFDCVTQFHESSWYTSFKIAIGTQINILFIAKALKENMEYKITVLRRATIYNSA